MTDVSGAARPDARRDASSTVDPVDRARALHEVYDAVLSGGSGRTAPRSVVSESWRRSLAARVDPDRHEAPVMYGAGDLDMVRASHPLSAVLPMLRSTLVSIADEAVHIMVVTDADGTVLWREGATSLLLSADAVGLAPGTTWSEEAIGTNAMGTALAVDAPVSIHSAEHLVRAVHSWTREVTSLTASGGVCGKIPWPKLKMCPGPGPAARKTERTPACSRSRGAHSRCGSRLP